jgi:hypothetical protein
MKGRLLVLVALGLALIALPTAALGSSARSASNSQTFTDSVGEDANSPDITSVVLTNDDNGNLTVKINISNRPAFTSDMLFLVFLDTDMNSATGDPQSGGADYAVQIEPGLDGLFKWSGSDYTGVDAPSLNYAYDSTGLTFHVSAQDLGNTKAFRFAVLAFSGITTDAQGNPDFTNAHHDQAPDTGLFTYQVLTKLKLSVTAFSTAPHPARAGKNFAALLAVDESDTGGPVTSGTVSCNATIGTKHLSAVHALANGIAGCVWHIPKKKVKGKFIRGSITFTLKGVTVKRTFSAKIG